MDTRLCPLCGLETAQAEEHATSTHNLTIDAAEAILEDGRKSLADQLERTARKAGHKTISLEDARSAAGMTEGGYL